MKPMKLAKGEWDDLDRYINEGEFAIEQKMDGSRGLARVTPHGVTWYSGHGGPIKYSAALLRLPQVTEQIEEAMVPFHGSYYDVWLDGEIMLSGEFRMFDAPQVNIEHMPATITTSSPYRWRRAVLQTLMGEFAGRPGFEELSLVNTAFTPEAKREVVQAVEDIRGEGVVVKRMSGMYEVGKRSKEQLKLKFVQTADVVVIGLNRNGKENAVLGIVTPTGMIEIGKCSMIGKPAVKVGDVIEVAFQNFSGRRIVQPRMKQIRHDKKPSLTETGLGQFQSYSREQVG